MATVHPHRFRDAAAARNFCLAGNATVTLRSVATETRFTYRVRRAKDSPTLHFVSLMTGTDNESSFTYFGTVRVSPAGAAFAYGRKAGIAEDSRGVAAFKWFWRNLESGHLSDRVECWHEAKCGACGRKLTVPESIETGLGPECSGKRARTQMGLFRAEEAA